MEEENKIEVRQGDLLLANPVIKQPDFYRSAVLILEQDASGGHIGLILNMPTKLLMQDLFDLPADALETEVFSGGPVDDNRLFMLHMLGDRVAGSMEVSEGLYVGGGLDDIAAAVMSGEAASGRMRFFIGYSGWGKGQLEKEIADNFWAVSRSYDPTLLLTGSGAAYWREEVARVGERYRSWLMIPDNPRDN